MNSKLKLKSTSSFYFNRKNDEDHLLSPFEITNAKQSNTLKSKTKSIKRTLSNVSTALIRTIHKSEETSDNDNDRLHGNRKISLKDETQNTKNGTKLKKLNSISVFGKRSTFSSSFIGVDGHRKSSSSSDDHRKNKHKTFSCESTSDIESDDDTNTKITKKRETYDEIFKRHLNKDNGDDGGGGSGSGTDDDDNGGKIISDSDSDELEYLFSNGDLGKRDSLPGFKSDILYPLIINDMKNKYQSEEIKYRSLCDIEKMGKLSDYLDDKEHLRIVVEITKYFILCNGSCDEDKSKELNHIIEMLKKCETVSFIDIFFIILGNFKHNLMDVDHILNIHDSNNLYSNHITEHDISDKYMDMQIRLINHDKIDHYKKNKIIYLDRTQLKLILFITNFFAIQQHDDEDGLNVDNQLTVNEEICHKYELMLLLSVCNAQMKLGKHIDIISFLLSSISNRWRISLISLDHQQHLSKLLTKTCRYTLNLLKHHYKSPDKLKWGYINTQESYISQYCKLLLMMIKIERLLKSQDQMELKKKVHSLLTNLFLDKSIPIQWRSIASTALCKMMKLTFGKEKWENEIMINNIGCPKRIMSNITHMIIEITDMIQRKQYDVYEIHGTLECPNDRHKSSVIKTVNFENEEGEQIYRRTIMNNEDSMSKLNFTFIDRENYEIKYHRHHGGSGSGGEPNENVIQLKYDHFIHGRLKYKMNGLVYSDIDDFLNVFSVDNSSGYDGGMTNVSEYEISNVFHVTLRGILVLIYTSPDTQTNCMDSINIKMDNMKFVLNEMTKFLENLAITYNINAYEAQTVLFVYYVIQMIYSKLFHGAMNIIAYGNMDIGSSSSSSLLTHLQEIVNRWCLMINKTINAVKYKNYELLTKIHDIYAMIVVMHLKCVMLNSCQSYIERNFDEIIKTSELDEEKHLKNVYDNRQLFIDHHNKSLVQYYEYNSKFHESMRNKMISKMDMIQRCELQNMNIIYNKLNKWILNSFSIYVIELTDVQFKQRIVNENKYKKMKYLTIFIEKYLNENLIAPILNVSDVISEYKMIHLEIIEENETEVPYIEKDDILSEDALEYLSEDEIGSEDGDEDTIDFSDLDSYLSINYIILSNAILTLNSMFDQCNHLDIRKDEMNEYKIENINDVRDLERLVNRVMDTHQLELFEYCSNIYDYLCYRRKKILKFSDIKKKRTKNDDDETSENHIVLEMVCLLMMGNHYSSNRKREHSQHGKSHKFSMLEYRNEYIYIRKNMKINNELHTLLMSKLDYYFQ